MVIEKADLRLFLHIGTEMETTQTTDAGDSDTKKGSQVNAQNETNEQANANSNMLHTDVLDLRVLFSEIGKRWWIVVFFLSVGAYTGLNGMHNFTGVYTARMVVAPVGSNSPVKAGGGVGLVNMLAGLQIQGPKPITQFDQLVHIIKTQAFANVLDEKFGLMDRIYGAAFDKETNSWRRPMGTEFELRETVNAYLNLPVWKSPSIENLSGYLSGGIEFKKMEESPFVIVSFRHTDPDVAQEMLQMIYYEAEKLVRKQHVMEQKKKRNFIEERFAETSIVEFKHALTDMMAEQAREEMMSHEDLPSVARIIEPVFVSKYQSYPNTLRLVGVPLFGATGLAFGLILLLVLIRRK
jgi:hypothetical protein